MKRFEIITEAEARRLAPGSTVELARGGHVTPLAQDTLTARRVAVLRDGEIGLEELERVGVRAIRTVAIGCDHTGLSLKQDVARHLRQRGLAVEDVGVHTAERVDYPDVAAAVARSVARGQVDAGIVIDGGGVGSAIAANKISGVRATVATEPALARYSREHAGANVLTLGATLVDGERAAAIVDAWLTATMREPRYLRRLAKIRRLERGEVDPGH